MTHLRGKIRSPLMPAELRARVLRSSQSWARRANMASMALEDGVAADATRDAAVLGGATPSSTVPSLQDAAALPRMGACPLDAGLVCAPISHCDPLRFSRRGV